MSVDALKMGEYGAYVWSSYGLTLLALVIIAASARRNFTGALKQAQRRIQVAAVDQAAGKQASQS